MKVSKVFSGDYLKAADLDGHEPVVVIATVEEKEFDDGTKLLISFQGKKKSLVANKTNAGRIAYIHGDETDDWVGKEIQLYTELVPFQGKETPAIRVRPAPRRQPQNGGPQHVVEQKKGYATSTLKAPEPTPDLPSDEVPF